jgi:hypothetical protein
LLIQNNFTLHLKLILIQLKTQGSHWIGEQSFDPLLLAHGMTKIECAPSTARLVYCLSFSRLWQLVSKQICRHDNQAIWYWRFGRSGWLVWMVLRQYTSNMTTQSS